MRFQKAVIDDNTYIVDANKMADGVDTRDCIVWDPWDASPNGISTQETANASFHNRLVHLTAQVAKIRAVVEKVNEKEAMLIFQKHFVNFVKQTL